jgi:hypothetical protein
MKPLAVVLSRKPSRPSQKPPTFRSTNGLAW